MSSEYLEPYVKPEKEKLEEQMERIADSFEKMTQSLDRINKNMTSIVNILRKGK